MGFTVRSWLSSSAERSRPIWARYTSGLALGLLGAALLAPLPGQSQNVAADTATRQGDHRSAARAWAEAATNLEKTGDSAKAREAWVRAAEALQAAGAYADALPPLERALDLARADQDPLGVASIRAARGQLYIALARTADARAELDSAIGVARQAQAQPLLASTLVNRANLDASQENLDVALPAYLEAAKHASEVGDDRLEARALTNAARVATQLETPEAGNLRSQAASEIRALPADRDRLDLLLHLSRTEDRVRAVLPRGEAREVQRLAIHGLLIEANGLATQLGDTRSAAFAQGYLGALYESENRLEEARGLTDAALQLAERAEAPDVALRFWQQRARIDASAGQRDDAIEAYTRAVALLETLRHALGIDYAASAASIRENAKSLHHAYVDQLLLRADERSRDPKFDATKDLLAVQRALEQLKATELRDYFEDECVDASLARSVDARTASPSAAIVYPVLLPDRLELLVSADGKIVRERVDVAAETLTESIRGFRHHLQKRSTNEYRRDAQQLHAWIVDPILSHLSPQIDTLVFVPGGPLRTIPMAALHDGERFLVERYAIAVTPGLELTDPRPLEQSELQAFLGGISQGVQGFQALPGVRDELRSIHALYPSEVLLDDAFVSEAIESQLASQPFNVVHIASHAKFDRSADGAFVLTHDGRLSMDELADFVELFEGRKRPLELLTLSACETAEGDDRAALGLSGIAVKAGARSALGTLWRAHDEAAQQLIGTFYAALREPGASRAGALRQAQLALLEERRFRHPAYWSAFLLIGNWL